MTDNQRGRIDAEVKAQNALKDKFDVDRQLADTQKDLKLQKELVG